MVFERNCLLGLLAAALLAPFVFQNQYALHIGVLIMFSVMLATSFNLIVGYVGEFPLGHTAFLGVGAYTAALFTTRLSLPFHVAMFAAPLLAGLFGLIIGSITLRLRGPFFVIVTLCFAEVLRLIANNWIELTNGPMGISGIEKPAWAGGDVLQQKMVYYYVGLLLATVSLFVSYRFVYSNLGRAAIAVRENRFVAQSIGISPFRLGLITFVLAAGIAGVAGGFYANYVSFVGPEVFGFSFMISDDHHGTRRWQGDVGRPGNRCDYRGSPRRVPARFQGTALFDFWSNRDGGGVVPASRHHGIYRRAS